MSTNSPIDDSTAAMSKAYTKWAKKKRGFRPQADDGFVAGWNLALVWKIEQEMGEKL